MTHDLLNFQAVRPVHPKPSTGTHQKVVKATLGDTASQVQLGNMYRRGDRVDQDYPAARYWFRKAADEGDTSGQNGLGYLYRLGLGYLKAANQGDATGQCNIGLVYDFSLIGSVNYRAAIDWYHKAARQGRAHAYASIRDLYANGQGVPQDYVKALNGAPRNLRKAFKWFENAALHGHSPSQLMLGVIHFYSDASVPLDYAKALYWIQKAASQGVALALFMVGTIHFKWLGVPQTYTTAIEWFHKAADRRFPQTQHQLSMMYLLGEDLARDFPKSWEWFRKAADQNFSESQFQVGNIYHYSRGVAKNYRAATEWYLKASGQGSGEDPDDLQGLEELIRKEKNKKLTCSKLMFC
ncbi:hypothetical protein KI688_006509 [Linnemannia hyalina]|uniref:HCP-like protein n=1 Tax=Linnemannia hyalina TaxID=64524 RepID=A0A9P7XJR7_9FUNG|nr:hypothetical protein KI688_006509 [Linnemannia hyalina]